MLGAAFNQIRECNDLVHEKRTPPAFCLAALSVSMVSIRFKQAHVGESDDVEWSETDPE